MPPVVFAFTPWVDRLGNAVRIKGGVAAITAAVVGFIANLAACFAIHVIFSAAGEARLGPVRFHLPDWSTLDWRAALLTALACALVFVAKLSVVRVLAISAVGGMILSAL